MRHDVPYLQSTNKVLDLKFNLYVGFFFQKENVIRE